MAIDQATQDKYNALALEIQQARKGFKGVYTDVRFTKDQIIAGNEKLSAKINDLKSQMAALEPKVPKDPNLLDKIDNALTNPIASVIAAPFMPGPIIDNISKAIQGTPDPEKELTDLLNNGTPQTDPKVVSLIKELKDKSSLEKNKTDLDSLRNNADIYVQKQEQTKKLIDDNTAEIKNLQTQIIVDQAKGLDTKNNEAKIVALQKEITDANAPAQIIDPKTGKPTDATTPKASDTSGDITVNGKTTTITEAINSIVKDPAQNKQFYNQLLQIGYAKRTDKPDVVAQDLLRAFKEAQRLNYTWEEYVPYQTNQSTVKIGQVGVPAQRDQQTLNTTEYLTKFAQENGINIPANRLAEYSANVLSGSTTVDDITNILMKNLVTKSYPAYAEDLYSSSAGKNSSPSVTGVSVSDLATPYKDLIAKSFGIDASTIKLNDPRLAKMMQYVDPATGKPAVMPLYQAYSNIVQKDPGWGKTQDAWENLGAKFNPILGDIGGAPAEFRNQSYKGGL